MRLKARSALMHYKLFIVLSILSVTFANKIPLRINVTASMPRGIYWLIPSNKIRAGDFVMVCLDDSLAQFALQRRYLHAGDCKNGAQPLLKQVVAGTGDTVRISATSIQINNIALTHSTTRMTDSHNRLLPSIRRGIYQLKSNQLWLYGTESSRSWDSRYFGLVKSSTVLS